MAIGITGTTIGSNLQCKANEPAITARALVLLERRYLAGGVVDDLGEGFGVEAGSADECAVDVFETAEGLGVVGFDGAAVEDADGGGEGWA